MTQEELEIKILELFLTYGDELTNRLLVQSKHIKVDKREVSALGFFTYFSSPEKYRVDNYSKRYSDLYIKFRNGKERMTFILYITQGKIDCLEGYTAGIDWNPEYLKEFDEKNFHGGGPSIFFKT